MIRALLIVLLMLSGSVGCAKHATSPNLSKKDAVDVLLVPGCPTRGNGSHSKCLWFRATWAHEIWKQGLARRIVTSGGAVYNPYVEAISLKRALVALGIPADQIYTETQARHTDENVAYALALFPDAPPESFGVASHGFHARIACRLARAWGTACTVYPAPEAWVEARVADRPPRIRIQRVRAPDWESHDEHEHGRRIEQRKGLFGHGRVYLAYLTWGRIFGRNAPVAPGPEPTLMEAHDHEGEHAGEVTP